MKPFRTLMFILIFCFLAIDITLYLEIKHQEQQIVDLQYENSHYDMAIDYLMREDSLDKAELDSLTFKY